MILMFFSTYNLIWLCCLPPDRRTSLMTVNDKGHCKGLSSRVCWLLVSSPLEKCHVKCGPDLISLNEWANLFVFPSVKHTFLYNTYPPVSTMVGRVLAVAIVFDDFRAVSLHWIRRFFGDISITSWLHTQYLSQWNVRDLFSLLFGQSLKNQSLGYYWLQVIIFD